MHTGPVQICILLGNGRFQKTMHMLHALLSSMQNCYKNIQEIKNLLSEMQKWELKHLIGFTILKGKSHQLTVLHVLNIHSQAKLMKCEPIKEPVHEN
jgi:recombinational DNA repair protein RecR